jgi:hypothetical protein
MPHGVGLHPTHIFFFTLHPREVVMKTFLIVLVSVLMVVSFGCEEAAVDPVIASNSPVPVPAATIQKIFLDEKLDVNSGEGFSGSVYISGVITYQMVKVQAVLGKDLPVGTKTAYTTLITGKGEMVVLGGSSRVTLAKPNTYSFFGTTTMVLVEGSKDIDVTFRIQGEGWPGGMYHIGLNVSPGFLEKGTSRLDLF